MTAEPSPLTGDRDRALLESLVARCLQALDAGDPLRVEEVCADHPEHADTVRRRLEALNRLTRPAVDRPKKIGPYRVLDVLGEGGMGTVYLAEQKEPVRRRVALKVIRTGVDSAAVLRRFELERQALALMSHDNIARIFEAGVTEQGQPYFVMEYVKGTPITEFCDAHRLSVEARLALFARVCSAVQHAHHKGVIHRDLKPGNILVVEEDEGPVPKVIDFGLARATDHMLLQRTMFTELGMVVGTPEYMSPEQADPGSADVDTRTDVYSLGVILHELMVGRLPFAPDELRRGGLLEMQRLLREVEPRRPSATFRGMGLAMAPAATARSTSIRGLRKVMESDLDWAILKALQKDRRSRYETPSELAAELRRFLAHEPLVAGPPSAVYRLRKALRRRRGLMIAGALVLATALVGQVVAFHQARTASDRTRSRLESEFGRAVARLMLSPQKKVESELARSGVDAGGLDGFSSGDGLEKPLFVLIKAAREECLEAQAKTLYRILQHRFGAIPEPLWKRVLSTGEHDLARAADLNRWTLRAVTAPTIEAVFEDR